MSGTGQRFEHKNSRANLLLLHQAFRVAEGDRLLGGIFRIRPLKPLCGIGACAVGLLRELEECSACGFALAALRASLREADNVLLCRVEGDDSFERGKSIGFAASARQFLEAALVTFERQLAVRSLKQLSEPDLLVGGRGCETRQFFVSQARPDGITGCHLPFKKFPQKPDCIWNSLQ